METTKRKAQIVKMIAGKLAAEGMSQTNYNRPRAEVLLSRVVLPVWCLNMLGEFEERIVRALPRHSWRIAGWNHASTPGLMHRGARDDEERYTTRTAASKAARNMPYDLVTLDKDGERVYCFQNKTRKQAGCQR